MVHVRVMVERHGSAARWLWTSPKVMVGFARVILIFPLDPKLARTALLGQAIEERIFSRSPRDRA